MSWVFEGRMMIEKNSFFVCLWQNRFASSEPILWSPVGSRSRFARLSNATDLRSDFELIFEGLNKNYKRSVRHIISKQ